MPENNLKQKYENFYSNEETRYSIADFNAHRLEYRNLVWASKCFYASITLFLSYVFGCVIIAVLPFPEAIKDSISLMCLIVVIIEAGLMTTIYRLAPNHFDFSDIDPEANLKKALMPKFVQLFGDFEWQKNGKI